MIIKLIGWLKENLDTDKPETWTFDKLKRGADGRFRDVDLVNILTAATDTVSGAFGARNTPVALKAVEMLGINQGRQWGLASLNEFRQFFKLKPFTSFKDINSQPGIAEACKFSVTDGGRPQNPKVTTMIADPSCSGSTVWTSRQYRVVPGSHGRGGKAGILTGFWSMSWIHYLGGHSLRCHNFGARRSILRR